MTGTATKSSPSLGHHAVTGTAWGLVETWGARLMTTAVFILLSRELDANAFGVVALAVLFADFGNRLVNQGFGSAIVQRDRLEDAHLDTAFWLGIGVGLLLALISILTAPWLEHALDAPGLTPVLRVMSARFLLDAVSAPLQSALQRDLRFAVLALRRLLATAVSCVVAGVLVVVGAGVWALVMQVLVQQAVGLVILAWASTWTPRLRISRSHFRDLFGFSASVTGIEFVQYVGREGEKVVIAAVLSPAALGIYAVGRRFPSVVNDFFSGAVNRVSFPILSRIQSQPERQRRAVHQATRLMSFFSGPAFLTLALLAPEIIHLAIGHKWTAAVPIVRAFAVIGFLQVQATFVASAVMASGKAGVILRLRTATALLNLATMLIVARHGVPAIALAAVANRAIGVIATFVVGSRATGISLRDFLQPLVRPASAAVSSLAVMAIARSALPISAPLEILTTGLAGAAAYLIAVMVLAPGLFAELRTLVTSALRSRAPHLPGPVTLGQDGRGGEPDPSPPPAAPRVEIP